MVKISLQIKATLENIEELYVNHAEYSYVLKLKCLNCGEISEKWHDVTESQTFPTKTGKTDTHYLAKCKLCGRENNLDIVEESNGKYTNKDTEKFKSIVTFDCRGIEPIDFSPSSGWVAKVEDSTKVFHDIDLSEKEWVEYDENISQSVGVYELQAQFVKVK